MGKRRGFFAELAHQAAVAEKNRQRAQAAAVREQGRLQREAERAFRAAERAQQQAQRADAATVAAAEREFKRLHIAAQESEVESRNAELAIRLSDIDNVLSTTLEVDDYVDLERLRKTAEHPLFASRNSEPFPPPPIVEAPPEPVFVMPEPPRGIGALFGGKKKHGEAIAAAQAHFARVHQGWRQVAAAVPMKQFAQLAEHSKAEETRQAALAADRARYEDECAQRQRTVDESNASLDALIRELDLGTYEAVEEYLGIVFSNSVYPSEFPWPPDYSFDADTSELSIELEFPGPSEIPTARRYKYVRATDEIAVSEQTQKERRDRYAALVNNMTLRTLHEVWEADRGGKIASISLVGSVHHVDPATGKDVTTPLVAVAVDRDTFTDIDLRRVSPAETLRHLRAVVSKNSYALTPIQLSPGVRGH